MLEPWQSWGIVCIAGAGAYLYYSRVGKSKRGRGRAPQTSEQAPKRDTKLGDDNKGRRKKGDHLSAPDQVASDVSGVSVSSVVATEKGIKKRKGVKRQPDPTAQSSAVDVNHLVDHGVDDGGADDEDMDNKEFAKQMFGLKVGTSLNKSSNVTETRKTKKPGKRNEGLPVIADDMVNNESESRNLKGLSTASSTTGADADDDLSPAVSPEMEATRAPTRAGDISDMLEVPKEGPSILRLTEPPQPQAVRPQNPKKPTQVQETKKQRQNKQKNEEKKMAREEAEKERRVLLEKQLRTAREAEGRPARNGLAPAQPPTASVWHKSGGETTSTLSAAVGSTPSLLDTFDQPAKPVNSAPGHEMNRTSAGGSAWAHQLPSEEEQMRILGELEGNAGWNTVQKGGRAKKKVAVADGRALDSGRNRSATDGSGSIERNKSIAAFNGANQSELTDGSTNSTASESGADSIPSGNRRASGNPLYPLNQPKPQRADPTIWNRDNIRNHPDYDPSYPWALIGHPDDSDWAVV